MKTEASVALVLCEREADLALLFIQRASHPGDRWSGHIAYPGGRVEVEDAGPRETAERETLEEVGLDLSVAQPIARLDDLRGFGESILVSGFVYALASPVVLTPNREVASAFWMSFEELESSARQVRRPFEYRGHDLVLPSIRVLEDDHPVLWGLSYRFLELLMAKCGRPVESMPWTPEI
jgi:8-oxo-dGTP pyrophosphatase MutT (NUDIX family)